VKLILGAALFVVVGFVFRLRPRVGTVLWLLVVAFVPVWSGLTLKLYFEPAMLVGIVLIIFGAHGWGKTRFGLADFLVAAFMLSCLLPIVTGGATLSTVFVAIASWLLPYLIGRVVASSVGVSWLYGLIAVIFAIVSAGLLVEFVSGWNPFASFPIRNASLYQTWSELQVRGGVTRSEGAFGHSIAAGSAAAMAIPMALGSRFRPWLRICLVLLIGGGVVVTISRVSILGAVLGVALVVLLLRDLVPRVRVGVVVTGLVLAVASLPFILKTLASAGDEATASADYRGSLVELLPGITPLGFSPMAHRTPDGTLFFGSFRSIDSQLILTGLQYGWFALILGVIGLAAAVFTVLTRRASAATISVVAQIPALATVALITQYADFFWFVVGLAVLSQREMAKPERVSESPLRDINRPKRTRRQALAGSIRRVI